VAAAAKGLAARLDKAAPTPDERVRLAFRLTYGRLPTPDEANLARTFMQESPLSELCRALMNANEFVYLD
jgi:hypothetical protein